MGTEVCINLGTIMKKNRTQVRTHFAQVGDRKRWIKHFALLAMALT